MINSKKEMIVTEDKVELAVISQLEIIDDFLTKKEVDIKERPFAAADIFVKNCIIRVGEESPTDNYIVAPWFKHIINPINKWYKNKYGSIVFTHEEKVVKGFIIYRNIFFELVIPLRISRQRGDLCDYIFPKEILSDEKVFDFLKQPPRLSENSQDKINLEESIRKIVNFTRGISNNIVTAHPKDEFSKGLLNGIQPHIQNGISDILSGEKQRRLNSYWEFHLAVEKSMKFLIIQANEKFKKTHDLDALWTKLSLIKPSLIERQKLDKLPKSQDVIKYRYGEGPQKSCSTVYVNYVTVLELVNSLTQEFNRKVIFNNTVFTLGKLPYSK